MSALNWNGTTKTEHSTPIYRILYPKLYTNTNIQSRQNLSMHQQKQFQYSTEQRYRQRQQIHHLKYQLYVVGTFAYYSSAVDPTMAATMSSIASRQSSATEKLEEEVKQFLDYCATHPNAGVRFVASDMIMALHSDASYLSQRQRAEQ